MLTKFVNGLVLQLISSAQRVYCESWVCLVGPVDQPFRNGPILLQVYLLDQICSGGYCPV